jgi:hypothetical protein
LTINKFLTIILLIGLAILSACGGEKEDSLATQSRPEPSPVIVEILQATEGKNVVTWRQFQRLAQWHRTLRNWPPADSSLLLLINERDDKLADALLLYRDSDMDGTIESAFVHYLTITHKSVPPSAPHPDADKWAQDYANRLSVKWPPAKGEFGIPYVPAHDLESLKSSLNLINKARYGWPEVIPASIFAFSDDKESGKQNAMWMADMAALAYHDEDVVRNQLRLWGYAVDSSFRWIDDADAGTQGFAVRNDSRMILSFRGTKGFTDMATDLLIKRDPVQWAAGGVHRGFSQAIDAVWVDVKDAIDEGRGNRNLYITGHSLGAALAQLAAIRLEGSGETVTSVYTFGSPFVGDNDFAEAYDSELAQRTFPYINHKDAVTRIPPRWLGFTPVATASTWVFINADHEMSRLEETNVLASGDEDSAGTDERSVGLTIDFDNPDNDDVIRSWFDDANNDLRVANEFIALSPDQLTSGSYDQTFNTGRVDDHGINQYLFKLGCAILEERWKEENALAKDEST